MLKIIAGQHRGRTLLTLPPSHHVRPILGRIKKSLFDILQKKMPNCRFLDLYAGIGAVGLEALSRGCAYAAFVEKDQHCLKVIHSNLEKFGFVEKSTVFRTDVLGDLGFLPKPFDIIFMGPPYVNLKKEAVSLVQPTLENIMKHHLLSETGLIVAQHHQKEKVETVPAGLHFSRQEIYGDTRVDFFTPASRAH